MIAKLHLQCGQNVAGPKATLCITKLALFIQPTRKLSNTLDISLFSFKIEKVLTLLCI